VGVSPVIAGKAVKGPAAKMFAEFGIQPSALSVAQHYHRLLNGFVFDRIDENQSVEIQQLGLRTMVTDTLMRNAQERTRLAKEVIEFGINLIQSR
jgi:LPPG:FO 2-phospho-L-lactate transferase